VKESGFSLWSLDSALKLHPLRAHVQTEHDAYITFANGAGFALRGESCGECTCDNDYVPPPQNSMG
jgi:hypothetical protein